jgi:hypothetical protein
MERTPNRRDEERRARPNIITQLSDRVQYVDSRVDCFSETKQELKSRYRPAVEPF